VVVIIFAVLSIWVIPDMIDANKKIDAAKLSPETTETEFRKHLIEELRKKNAEKVEAKKETRKIERKTQLLREAGKIKITGTRTCSQTENYLIIDIRNQESDLSIREMQNLYNHGWELIAASDRKFKEKRYIFKKMAAE